MGFKELADSGAAATRNLTRMLAKTAAICYIIYFQTYGIKSRNSHRTDMKNTLFWFLMALVLTCGFMGAERFLAQEALFYQPVLITSAGQSAEVQIASVLAKRADLDYTLVKSASAKDLAGTKTLVLSLGASLKGLGAAGLDVEEEKNRVIRLLAAAQEQNIPVICLHLGGESRRGQLSDDFISRFLPEAQMAIVVKSGNQDGLFTRICQKNHISLFEVGRAVDAGEPLKNAFHDIP